MAYLSLYIRHEGRRSLYTLTSPPAAEGDIVYEGEHNSCHVHGYVVARYDVVAGLRRLYGAEGVKEDVAPCCRCRQLLSLLYYAYATKRHTSMFYSVTAQPGQHIVVAVARALRCSASATLYVERYTVHHSGRHTERRGAATRTRRAMNTSQAIVLLYYAFWASRRFTAIWRQHWQHRRASTATDMI